MRIKFTALSLAALLPLIAIHNAHAQSDNQPMPRMQQQYNSQNDTQQQYYGPRSGMQQYGPQNTMQGPRNGMQQYGPQNTMQGPRSGMQQYGPQNTMQLTPEQSQAIQEMREKHQMEVRALLTPEQQSQFDQMAGQRQLWMDSRGMSPRGYRSKGHHMMQGQRGGNSPCRNFY